MKKTVALLAATVLGISGFCQSKHVESFARNLKGGSPVELTRANIKGLRHIQAYNIGGGGFVITSDDSRTREILGYSATGTLVNEQLPDGMRYWLEKFEDQIRQLGSTTLEELYATYKPEAKPTYPDSITALIATQWRQSGYGYNSLVPYDSVMAADSSLAHLNGHPTVGCGALAAAQIIRYWQFPQHGYGHHSYTYNPNEYPCWRYGSPSADFGSTTYNYSLMPEHLTATSSAAEVEAVATLLAQCGVACNMNYNTDCAGSSGSTISANMSGMQRYFHYNTDCQIQYYSNASRNWVNLLKNDLSQLRPVYYCGQSYRNDYEGTVAGGHAFVCDGYDADDLFHFNWGWGGYCDGYYAINVLRPLTQYDFSSMEYCIFNLHPSTAPRAILAMGSDLTLTSNTFNYDEPISGSYSITNLGDTTLNIFVGVNIYGDYDNQYYGCVDGRRVTVAPGDTVQCSFSYTLNLSATNYHALMQYSYDTFYAGIEVDETYYFDDLDHQFSVPFSVTHIVNYEHKYTNLVLFLRFADDQGTTPNLLNNINNIFHLGYPNVTEFFHHISYNKIDFQTVYSDQVRNSQVTHYTDLYNRGYFQPYSPSNPEGYTIPNPIISISKREAHLIERLCRYVDSLHLVPNDINLDCNGDGDIDNISIIVQGQTGEWAELLWPHMEYFPHDSIGYTLTINGKRVNTFNFEFDNSPQFAVRTFCHEMSHSLGLPDLYHYFNYTNVAPVYNDIMQSEFCHPAVIYKNRILHVADDPIQITQDGTYTINSNSSSPSNNLYYIKSAIDTNQWYTIEYRYRENQDLYERLTGGLVIGRWMDTVPMDINHCGNAYFDFFNVPNSYYVFRPNSDNDTINGNAFDPFFKTANNRTCFNANSNPHPFLADGTPENSFEIYDITDNGTTCTFSVRFFESQGINDMQPASLALYPNPATTHINLQGIALGTPVRIYNTMGQVVLTSTFQGSAISVASLPAGLYILSTPEHTFKFNKIK